MQVSANICSHVIHLCPVIIRIAELRNDGINRTEKYLLFLLNLVSSSGFFFEAQYIKLQSTCGLLFTSYVFA